MFHENNRRDKHTLFALPSADAGWGLARLEAWAVEDEAARLANRDAPPFQLGVTAQKGAGDGVDNPAAAAAAMELVRTESGVPRYVYAKGWPKPKAPAPALALVEGTLSKVQSKVQKDRFGAGARRGVAPRSYGDTPPLRARRGNAVVSPFGRWAGGFMCVVPFELVVGWLPSGAGIEAVVDLFAERRGGWVEMYRGEHTGSWQLLVVVKALNPDMTRHLYDRYRGEHTGCEARRRDDDVAYQGRVLLSPEQTTSHRRHMTCATRAAAPASSTASRPRPSTACAAASA